MGLVTGRRGFLGLLAGAIAAPAVIRTTGLLMPVRAIRVPDAIWINGIEPAVGLFGSAQVWGANVVVSNLWSYLHIPDQPPLFRINLTPDGRPATQI